MRRVGIVVDIGAEMGARDTHLADGDFLALLQRHEQPDERAMQIDLLGQRERLNDRHEQARPLGRLAGRLLPFRRKRHIELVQHPLPPLLPNEPLAGQHLNGQTGRHFTHTKIGRDLRERLPFFGMVDQREQDLALRGRQAPAPRLAPRLLADNLRELVQAVGYPRGRRMRREIGLFHLLCFHHCPLPEKLTDEPSVVCYHNTTGTFR